MLRRSTASIIFLMIPQKDCASQLLILKNGAKDITYHRLPQDLDGLVARLPNKQGGGNEGSGKWIFEETKIQLARMNELLKEADMDRAIDSNMLDGQPFDRLRSTM
ncbi:MAG: hypothetical protein ACRDDA_04390 [Aeromonas sp.]